MAFIVRKGDIKPITKEIIEETNQQFKALARLNATHIPESISNPAAHAYKKILKDHIKQIKKHEDERPFRESQERMQQQLELMRQSKEREKEFQIEIQLEALRRHSKEQQVQTTQPQAEPVVSDKPKGVRRDNQVNQICEIGKKLGYDLLNIPEGGKAEIRAKCMPYTKLFTKDGFTKAWLEANNRGLIRIQNKDKYLQK